MPSSRRRRRNDRTAAKVIVFVVLGLSAYGFGKAWYLRHQAEVDSVLRWAVPLAGSLIVLVLCMLIRSRIRDSKSFAALQARQRRVAQERLAAERAANAPAATAPDLPPREYLYRVWGWWQDPATNLWYENVLLYIGRSIDFVKRREQHDLSSWWVANATCSNEEYFDSYVDERGYVVIAHDRVCQAERDAIEAEAPRHNIIYNGELGRQERELRAAIKAGQPAPVHALAA